MIGEITSNQGDRSVGEKECNQDRFGLFPYKTKALAIATAQTVRWDNANPLKAASVFLFGKIVSWTLHQRSFDEDAETGGVCSGLSCVIEENPVKIWRYFSCPSQWVWVMSRHWRSFKTRAGNSQSTLRNGIPVFNDDAVVIVHLLSAFVSFSGSFVDQLLWR